MSFIKNQKYNVFLLILFFILPILFVGCSKGPEEEANTTLKPTRVVSLMSSYTETWLLSGGKETLIGVTEDAVTDRGLDVASEIAIVGTYKDPNLEVLLSLSPDFVILSADLESHQKIAETLKASNIAYELYHVEKFEDYLSMLKSFTDMTGREDLYTEHGLKVKDEIGSILTKVKIISKNEIPSVLFIRAFSGGAKAMSGDDMVGIMLEQLGVTNISSQHPSLLKELSMEEILMENPDFIFVTTMGDSEAAIKALKDGIEQNPSWNSLQAVKNNNYIILPKELFHYKPNARWGESYEYLAKIIYPELFE